MVCFYEEWEHNFIFIILGIISELNTANDLESTFRRIAKEKSDCSSGQRGGKNEIYYYYYFGR